MRLHNVHTVQRETVVGVNFGEFATKALNLAKQSLANIMLLVFWQKKLWLIYGNSPNLPAFLPCQGFPQYDTYVCMYVCTYMYVCMYIYIERAAAYSQCNYFWSHHHDKHSDREIWC